MKILVQPRTKWSVLGKYDKWISPDEWWIKSFRFSRKKFFDVIFSLKTTIGPNQNTQNFRSLSVAKKLAITLNYLEDTGSLGVTANHFGKANSIASKVIFEVWSEIYLVLGSLHLHLSLKQSLGWFKHLVFYMVPTS